MDMQKKKRLFLIGGVVLAVLVAAVLLVIVLGGVGGNSYQKHYDAAESAFLRRDYTTALDALEKAIDKKPTEEAYLLMASVYEAQGDVAQATRVLYLGYSQVGGESISRMLDRLKGDTPAPTATEDGGVTVAGVTFTPDTTSVVLAAKGLGNSDLAAICRLTGLQNLSLSDNMITDLSPVAALTELTSLQLTNNRVASVSALSGLRNLKTLYLDGNPVQDLTPLYQLSSLRTLSMKDVEISADDLAALEAALPNCNIFTDGSVDKVTRLTLGGKTFSSDVTELNLGGLGLTDISELEACTNLVKLDLRDNRIQDISPLVELQKLEDLCLWNNEITDVTPLMSLSKLTRLDVDGNQVRDITALEYLPELKELWLNNNELRSFAPLGRMTGLTRLGLKNTGLTDAQLETLYTLTGLTELTIEGNPGVTMGGYEALAKALEKCTIAHSELLWSVTLGGKTYYSDATEIKASNSGVRDLGGLEHFTELKVLELDDNRISDLSPLYGLTKLKSLSIRGNGIPETEVRKLRERLPGCEIVWEDPEPSPNPSPEPSSEPTETPGTDEAAIGRGSGAAVSAAGSGSGYAILWCVDDTVSTGIREGFVGRAAELGMNVVFDGTYPAGLTDFSVYLAAIQEAGADVVFLAVNDAALSLILAQAEELDYAPHFIQVY